MTSRYILYIRQSVTNDREDSLSLHFQERALRELVARDGGVVIEPPIIDADERGWDPHRPGIAELIERTKGQRPDAVAVYAMSRFARDNWLAEGIWRQLIQVQPGLQFKSVTEPHAHDDMVRGILGVISQAERKRMGAFLRSAFAERARQGKQHGRAPYGYRKDADGRLIVEPSERDVLLAIAERFEAGWSLRRITFWLRDQYPDDRRWHTATVRDLLSSPTLAGAIRCGEVVEWDSHEPIIDRVRQERIVAQLDTRRWVRTKRHTSWLERLMVCGCGAPMDFFGRPHDVEKRLHSNFRCAAHTARMRFDRQHFPPCTSSPRSITAPRAERLVAAALADAFSTIPDWRAVEQRATARVKGQAPDAHRQRRQMERDLDRLTVERDRLLVLYRRATIEVDRWEAEDRQLAARIADLRARIAALPEPPSAVSLQATHQVLSALAGDVAMLAGFAPDRLAAIMRSHGITAQLHDGGVRLIWPESLGYFFEG
jgi:DNA invertase Pin-like site-specific DNA recombinase